MYPEAFVFNEIELVKNNKDSSGSFSRRKDRNSTQDALGFWLSRCSRTTSLSRRKLINVNWGLFCQFIETSKAKIKNRNICINSRFSRFKKIQVNLCFPAVMTTVTSKSVRRGKNSILSFILLFLSKDYSQTTQLISHKNNQIKQSLRNFNNRNTEISFWHAVWENEGGLGLKNN